MDLSVFDFFFLILSSVYFTFINHINWKWFLFCVCVCVPQPGIFTKIGYIPKKHTEKGELLHDYNIEINRIDGWFCRDGF